MTTCSSAGCDTRRRREGAAHDPRRTPTSITPASATMAPTCPDASHFGCSSGATSTFCGCSSARSAAPPCPSLLAAGMTIDHAPPLTKTADDDDDPLPTAGIRSPTADDDHHGNSCQWRCSSTATSPSVAALAFPRAHTGWGARPTRVPPSAPLGAADYQSTHRHAPPSALAQQFAHAHVPAACPLCTGPESLRTHRSEHAPLLGSSALLTDDGTEFDSQLLTELCRLWGIKRCYTPPLHPPRVTMRSE